MDGELGRLGQLSTAKNSTLDTALVRTPLVFEVPDLGVQWSADIFHSINLYCNRIPSVLTLPFSASPGTRARKGGTPTDVCKPGI